MERLNKKFKRHLQGRSIVLDGSVEGLTDVTKFEERVILHLIKSKKMGYKLPTLMPVSERISLDFIGWDNPEYNDVLIIKYSKYTIL